VKETQHNRRIGQHTAFTLIELLAVIAIIAIIAALLFPALRGVSERSKKIHCMSNMRQWGSGLTMFLADNNGVFPEEGRQGGGIDYYLTSAWFNVLAPYMGTEPLSNMVAQKRAPCPPDDRSVFTCPSLKPQDVSGTFDNQHPVFSYAYNLWIDTGTRQADHDAFGRLLRISQILKPAKFVVFGEDASAQYDHTAAKYLKYRHDGTNSVNLCFADGHVANFFWTNVFVPPHGSTRDNVGVIWDPDGNPPQEDF